MPEHVKNRLYCEMCQWNVRGNDAVRQGNSVQADKCYFRAEQIAKELNLQTERSKS